MANVLKASKFIQLPKPLQTKLVRSSHVIPINDKFIPYFGSREKIILLYGSYGNGKSKFVAQDLIEKCRTDKYLKCFYGRKIYDEVRKSFFDELCTEIEERNLGNEFTYSRKDNSTMIITHRNGNKFIPFGASDARNLKSIKDASHIVCEEFDQFTEKDFGFLLSRLRTEKAQTQFYGMFNTEPLVENHWLRQTFFNDKIEHELKPLKIFGTYKENYFIDHKDYLEKLKLIANGRDYILEAIANGMMGVTVNKNPFFYALRRNIHFTDERYSLPSNTQLYLSFDFNKTPSTLVIGCVHQKEIAVIDLILCDENTMQGKSPLEAVCNTFKRKYLDSGLITRPYLIVTGDASGMAGGADKKHNENFYTKIESILGISKSQRKIRKKNIEHKLSQEICNSLIYNCNFMIYKSAELSLLDMEQAQIENGKLVKDNKDNGMHITDAVRYYIDCVLNFERWQDYLRYYNKI